MPLGDLAHQAQAQADATRVFGVPRQAIEGLEDAFALLGGHARPTIGHGQLQLPPCASQKELDLGPAITACVFEQVAQGAAQQPLVALVRRERKGRVDVHLGAHARGLFGKKSMLEV